MWPAGAMEPELCYQFPLLKGVWFVLYTAPQRPNLAQALSFEDLPTFFSASEVGLLLSRALPKSPGCLAFSHLFSSLKANQKGERLIKPESTALVYSEDRI